MEKWGLGPGMQIERQALIHTPSISLRQLIIKLTSIDELYKTNPDLIFTRISGYGQSGPYSKRAGYASVCEGMGGFRYVNGHPGQPPVRPNISLGDSLAGLHAALGVVMGLLARQRIGDTGASKTGQVVDVAIYESVLGMMEGVIPEFDRFNEVSSPIIEPINFFKVYIANIFYADPPSIRNNCHWYCSYKYLSMCRWQARYHWW